MELLPHPYTSVDDFVDKTEKWLCAEWRAEAKEYSEDLRRLSLAKLREDGILISGLSAVKVTFTVFDRPLWHLVVAESPKNSRRNKHKKASDEKGNQETRLTASHLPGHRFRVGSRAGLSMALDPRKERADFECVIHEVAVDRIVVQPSLPEESDPRALADVVKSAHLFLTSSDTTIARQQSAVKELHSLAVRDFYSKPLVRDLVQCCFSPDDTVPAFNSEPLDSLLQKSYKKPDRPQLVKDVRLTDSFSNKEVLRKVFPELNESQRAAIAMAVRTETLACIHGPPGTGKTTTLAHVIKLISETRPRSRILACAPSNTAVNNLLIACLELGVEGCVRLGTETRLRTHLLPLCAERLVWECMVAQLTPLSATLAAAKARLLELIKAEMECTNPADLPKIRREKLQKLEKIFNSRQAMLNAERRAAKEVLGDARVLFSTCAGARNAVLNLSLYGDKEVRSGEQGWTFDLVIIDEAAQALEAACWIPALLGKRLLLAGDHHQLPPTIKGPHEEGTGLSLTLFERLIKRLGPAASQLLDTQYRMHGDIMGWSSKIFYDSRLNAGPGVPQDWTTLLSQKRLSKLCSRDLPSAMVWIETAGMPGGFEDASGPKKSRQMSHRNQLEAAVVLGYLRRLRFLFGDDELFQNSVGVIAPYNGQVALIKQLLVTDEAMLKIEVDSVDGFQGREKNIIILSLVRSNAKKRIGFLKERRRLNVAITRARWHVGIVGDSVTTGSDPTLKDLHRWIQKHGQVVKADVYVKSATPTAPNKQPCDTSLTKAPVDDDEVRRLCEALPNLKGGERLESSTNLTAEQRSFLHKRASQLGLRNRSIGKGAKRKIVFTKKVLAQPQRQQPTSSPPAPPLLRPPPLPSPPAFPPTSAPPSTSFPPPTSPPASFCPAEEEFSSVDEEVSTAAMEHQTSFETTVSTSSTVADSGKQKLADAAETCEAKEPEDPSRDSIVEALSAIAYWKDSAETPNYPDATPFIDISL